jgi:hypothetical protein
VFGMAFYLGSVENLDDVGKESRDPDIGSLQLGVLTPQQGGA